MIGILKTLKRIYLTVYIQVKGWLMVGMVQVFPQFTYIFVLDGRLPNKAHRCVKESNPLDEFIVVREVSSPLENMERVNIVMRGTSFDRAQLAGLPGTTFLINWPEKVDRPGVVYATADHNDLREFVEKKFSPLLFVQIVYIDPQGKFFPSRLKPCTEEVLRGTKYKHIVLRLTSNMAMPALGSGLACIAALGQLARDIHIYGWDHYLNFSPRESSARKVLMSLNQTQNFSFPCATIACAIYNFHYAIRFGQLPQVHNYGFTGELVKFKKLEQKLNRIFYNNTPSIARDTSSHEIEEKVTLIR